MLAEVVKRENPMVYDLYTTFRKHGMNRASLTGDDDDDVADSRASFEAMKTLARDISPRDARGVMKTFGIALNLVNAAEVHHRMRLVRTMNGSDDGPSSSSSTTGNVGPLPMVEDSICGTMEILLRGDESSQEAVDPQRIFDRLMTQKCEIVLTAHPTEVNRKTLIRKCEPYYIMSCRRTMVDERSCPISSHLTVRTSSSFPLTSCLPRCPTEQTKKQTQTRTFPNCWRMWNAPTCTRSSAPRR
jgi:hypothetical protein